MPSVAVAASLGRGGVSTLLVVSQVVLSIVLPFIVFPLLFLTSSARVMSVHKPRTPLAPPALPNQVQAERDGGSSNGGSVREVEAGQEEPNGGTTDVEAEREEMVNFSNGKFVMGLGWVIWIVIVIANGYTIVTLAMGED